MSQIVVADQRAGRLDLLDPASGRLSELSSASVLAEHAGVLPLADGSFAYADDDAGAVLIADPARAEALASVPAAIPAEHLAVSPDGTRMVLTSGLGANMEAFSDQVTVLTLREGQWRSRRFRCRTGEPGAAALDSGMVLRHREPGAIEFIPWSAVDAAGPHVPALRGEACEDVSDMAHGDALDPVTGLFYTASERGVESFTVEGAGARGRDAQGGRPVPRGVLPTSAGRAFFLRFCGQRRQLATTLRGGPADPKRWAEWTNAVWVADLETGCTRETEIGPGLVFRCALTRSAVVVTRVHPDGDELVTVSREDGSVLARRPLEPMEHGPQPGREPWDAADRRAVAADPHGERAAVTRGGHGEVLLVDLLGGGPDVLVRTPGPLSDGGHLAWLPGPSAAGLLDGIGR